MEETHKINTRLTRDMLVEYGIRVDCDDRGVNHIYRTTYFHNVLQEIELTPHLCWHAKKDGTRGKNRWTIMFRYNRRMYTLQLSRVIYAWYCQEVPEGYHVDHIDNDSENNNINNLQLLTPTENNLKRKMDAIKEAKRNEKN